MPQPASYIRMPQQLRELLARQKDTITQTTSRTSCRRGSRMRDKQKTKHTTRMSEWNCQARQGEFLLLNSASVGSHLTSEKEHHG